MLSPIAVAAAHYPKMTYARFKKAWDFFSSFDDVWNAEIPELLQAGWDQAIASEFISWREQTSLELIVERLEKENITPLVLGQEAYPPLLAQITDPPFVLFVRGRLPIAEQPAIAVVGTRRCTSYGKLVTEEISRELAEQAVAIISGLALGIDGIAHEAALSVHGTTVAVLGSGVDARSVYPAAHHKLAEHIVASGNALVSEYPPGFEPTQYSFPARNRIIAGLAGGVLVTEAPTQSGALITFKYAMDYNREVFAVPHPITSEVGRGGNGLIKLGAKITVSSADILEELNIHHIKDIIANNELLPENPTEAVLIPLLSKQPAHIDTLIKQSRLDSATVNGALVLMEMKGKIKNIGGMMFVLR